MDKGNAWVAASNSIFKYWAIILFVLSSGFISVASYAQQDSPSRVECAASQLKALGFSKHRLLSANKFSNVADIAIDAGSLFHPDEKHTGNLIQRQMNSLYHSKLQ